MKEYTFVDEVYKDDSPLKTVAKIKGILAQNGIETEEIWMQTNVPYCYAIRVNVLGTTFGTNGKGLSRELALASGYGEMMERLQLGFITGGATQKDGSYSLSDGQDRMVSVQEIMDKDLHVYDKIAEALEDFTGTKMSARQIVSQYKDEQDMVQTVAFYDVSAKKTVNFPVTLLKRIYSTNGCAAGNSMEEAIVQALSETVERNHQMKIIAEGMTPPDVPEEVLKQYKTSYEIITYVRSQGYKVLVKDCSLGTKFPVICVCFINQRTGKYHTHFGACPVFEIALARALTESFQGRNIKSIAAHGGFLAGKEQVRSARNISNELCQGAGEKQLSFFVGTPQYAYNPNAGFRGGSNKELLKECLEYFKELGYEVLVRDSSSLGFPTYQVLIPGYSESFIYRILDKDNELRYLNVAVKALRNLPNAKLEDLMGLLMHMSRISMVDKTITGAHGFRACSRLPGKMTTAEDMAYMALNMAHVYYTLGRGKEALASLTSAMSLPQLQEQPLLNCLKQYLNLKLSGADDGYIRSVLDLFHGTDMTGELLDQIAAGKNPLDRYVLTCEEKCTEACPYFKACCHKRVLELMELLNEKIRQFSYESFTQKLQELL